MVWNGVMILIVGRHVGFASVGAAARIIDGAKVGRPMGMLWERAYLLPWLALRKG